MLITYRRTNGEHHWWTEIGALSAQQFTKELKEENGKCSFLHYRDTSVAAGARKPSESQNAKALWAMKAAEEREEELYDPARKDNILRRKQTRLEAETLKACALIGLHLLAAEGEVGSSGRQSPDLRRRVEIRLPKKPGLGQLALGK